MFKFLNNLFGSNNGNETLKNIMKDGAYLVDVRTPSEFASGHVKGSVNIPLNIIQNKVSSLKSKKHIVVFCRSGARSAQAKAILERNGLKNIYNGGTWQKVNKLKNEP